MQAGKQTYVIERVATPTRRIDMTATWVPGARLEVCREGLHPTDGTGPEVETEVIYRVPPDRIPEVLSAVPAPCATVEELLAWAAESSAYAADLDRALAELDPAVIVFSRVVHR